LPEKDGPAQKFYCCNILFKRFFVNGLTVILHRSIA